MIQFKIHRDEYGLHGKFALFDFNLQIKFNKTYNLAYTVGLRNNVAGMRLMFCDYDSTTLEFLIEELKYIQEKFFLSDFYIFQSSQKKDGFHAICLDKMKYKKFLEAMSYTSCDDYYKIKPIENDNNSWVLRILNKSASQKPKLIKILKSKYQNRKKSLAHALYLKYQHGVKINQLKNLDDNKILHVIKYGTLNFIDAKKLSKDIKQAKN